MLKLLIIDDEKLIREGLVNYIKWSEFDIEVVGTAGDGQSALQLIFDKSPDLLISDIKMPSMSGTEMLQEIRNRGLATEVIFISAYSDFKYAQDAIKLGAFDYILKPIEENILIEVVKRCKSKIANNKSKTISRINSKEVDYLTEKERLSRILTGKTSFNNDAADILSFDYSLIILANIKFMNIDKQQSHEIESHILNLFSSENLIGLIEKHLIIDTIENEKCIIFMDTNTEQECFYDKVKRFCTTLKESLSFKKGILTISISDVYPSNKPIKDIYSESSCAALFNFVGKDNSVSEFRTIKQYISGKEYSYINYSKLLNYVQNEDTENVQIFFNEILLTFISTGIFNDLDLLKIECSKILDYVFDNLSEYPIKSALSDMNCDLSFKKVISRQNNISELLEVSKTIILNIIKFLNRLPSKTTNKLVTMALSYIHNNFKNNICLNDVASHLYITPSYLSKIFSEEMQISFSKYLLKYRIEMSKKLLSNPKYKVYEVSEMVGYSDVCHFTKIFKEIEGITPAKYKEHK